MKPRTGKIARLPRYVRDQLNERLERSEPGPQLLQWLNALKDVQALLQKNFAGVPISKQNLSEWRQGGFQEWLARRDFCEDIRDVGQMARHITNEYSPTVADDAVVVLAGRFSTLIGKWDRQPDQQCEARARVLNGLCRSVVQLQRGMHRARRQSFELEQLQEEKEKAENKEENEKLVAPLLNMLKLEPMAKIFGGGAIGHKIAKFILAVRSGHPAELDILPTDTYEEPAPDEETPTPPDEPATAEDSPEAESNPVKHSQTIIPMIPIPPEPLANVSLSGPP